MYKRRFSPQNIFNVYNELTLKKVSNISREEFLNKYNLNFGKEDVIIDISKTSSCKGYWHPTAGCKLIVDENPSVRFIIGGDGEERKSLEKNCS